MCSEVKERMKKQKQEKAAAKVEAKKGGSKAKPAYAAAPGGKAGKGGGKR